MAILGAILAIGFLVLVHEAGHYFVARWCKMRVERFSIGFGPAVYSWPRKEAIVREQASGREEAVATLYRVARKRPRGRVSVTVGAKKLEYTAAQLAALPLDDVHRFVGEAMDVAKSESAEIHGWEQVDFTLAPIPFGGFVQIDGMAVVEDVDPADERAYPNRPVWQRVATIAAGPATNYLTAVVLAFGLYSMSGVRSGVVEYTVTGTRDGYDAHGKLEKGDRIVRIDGEPLRFDETSSGLVGVVQAHGDKPMVATVIRGGAEVDVEVQAKLSPAGQGFWAETGRSYAASVGAQWPTHYLIGIEMDQHDLRAEVGIGSAVGKALAYPVDQSKMILSGLWKIVTRQEKGEVGGPVMITAMIKRSIDYGWIELVSLLMLLNVYLGLFNLLPLPALDGGRLAFLGYEIVTRRRPNPSVEQTVHAVGIMAFLVIMVLVTYKDIMRLFS